MKKLVCVAALFVSCATPYAKVKTAKTIEEARSYLGDYQPSITPYPPSAEAWYFDRNECVLFVDGKLRMSRDSLTERTNSNGLTRKTISQKQVVCSPSEAGL